MYKKSQEKSEEIVRLYKEGVGLTEIMKRTTSSQPTIKKVLSNSGMDYDLDKKKLYQEKLDQVVILYEQGKSQLYIEQELGLTRKTIRQLLRSKDLKYRDKSEQHHIRYGTELNHNAFDNLDSEVLYWIGLLYSDGHIDKNEYSIELTLHNNDKNHLVKFKNFLGSNREISKGNGDCSRIRINSKRLWERLMELSFTNDKSYTAKPNILLKDSRDFWRGCIDGDGGIYKYTSGLQITLCGTLETIFDFAIFCNKNANVADKYPSLSKNQLYQIHYYGKDAIKVADLLYKDSSVYLERKYEKYLEFSKLED